MSKLLVAGDYYPGERTEELSRKGEHTQIFGDFLQHMKTADLAITNLEAPLTDSRKAIAKKGPAIKSTPESMRSLAFAGFNLLTLANNHIMDYGEEGLFSTLDTCKQHDIDYVGIGNSLDEARKPFYKIINNQRIAILNFAENEFSTTHGNYAGANPLDPVRNYQDIQKAKEQADFVLVISHGGHETYPLPSPRMKANFRFFIDAGADSVINHHTHCFSGYEIYKGKPIFYSLGNFVFDWHTPPNEDWHWGYAVVLNIEKYKEVTFDIIPYIQNKEQAGIRDLTDQEAEQFEKRLQYLNQTIANDHQLALAFEEFCKKIGPSYQRYIEPHSNRVVHALQNRKWIPSFISSKKRLLWLNLIRCEAHRDVLLNLLKR